MSLSSFLLIISVSIDSLSESKPGEMWSCDDMRVKRERLLNFTSVLTSCFFILFALRERLS